MADDANPRVVIGDNQPPPTPYEAVKLHMDDLLLEARNWADNAAVETQGQADEISRLIDDLNKAVKAADEARVKEKAPFDEIVQEIQDRYNAYIAPAKNKQPGKITVAIDALKATLKPYLDKLAAEKRAAEEAARRAAEEAAQKAAEAMRAAEATDLAAREEAERLAGLAARAEAEAKRAASDKAHAHGGERAMGLKKTFTPQMIDAKAALLHYLNTQPETIKAYLLTLAEQDVRAGKRQIPGFEIIEGTKL